RLSFTDHNSPLQTEHGNPPKIPCQHFQHDSLLFHAKPGIFSIITSNEGHPNRQSRRNSFRNQTAPRELYAGAGFDFRAAPISIVGASLIRKNKWYQSGSLAQSM